MNRLLTCVAILICVSALAGAGQFNSTLDIGDDAPAWKELPGIDGKKHSLGELAESKAVVVVVVFTCNSCPYAVDVEDRLIKLANDSKENQVAVVAINVNKVKEDAFDKMKERAAEKEFSFPYLFDESQQIARDYGAIYTPTFFVLDGKRKVVYMGALDDSPNGKKISKRYVQDAIDAVLNGKSPSQSETAPVGCRVRFERKRRSSSNRRKQR